MQQGQNIGLRLLEALCWVFLLELPVLFDNVGSILLDAFVILFYFFSGDVRYNHKKLRILVLPVALAMVIGYVREFNLYNLFKDVFYLSTPIIAFMLGEIWARMKKPSEIPGFIMLMGVIFSIINIIWQISQYDLDVFLDPREFRDAAEYNYITVNNIAVLALAMVFSSLVYGGEMRFKIPKMAVLLVAVYLSGSRSIYLVVLLYFIVLLFPLYRRNFTRFVSVVGVIAVSLIIYATSSSGSRFIELIEDSTEEMKVQDYNSMADVSASYRGYEAYRAMVEYDNLSWFNKIFGGGCGQMVDLGAFSPFDFSEVPILHNGYPYLLVKVGIVGLLIFMAFFFRLIIGYAKKLRDSESMSSLTLLYYLLGFASICSMLFMHVGVNAIFNYSYVAPLYIISMIMYYERTKKF